MNVGGCVGSVVGEGVVLGKMEIREDVMGMCKVEINEEDVGVGIELRQECRILCPHERRHDRCRQCGGKPKIANHKHCYHNREKRRCIPCGGKKRQPYKHIRCMHDTEKRRCVICDGAEICPCLKKTSNIAPFTEAASCVCLADCSNSTPNTTSTAPTASSTASPRTLGARKVLGRSDGKQWCARRSTQRERASSTTRRCTRAGAAATAGGSTTG